MSLANVLLFSLGVAAIAAPLWVHLRLGKVKKRAVVSTLRLMRATPQTSKSPRRLVDLPLFLLRALAVLLIALGFGRLLIPGMRGEDAREYAAFVLDVSGSMRALNGKVWEDARTRTLDELRKLDGGSRVAIVLSPAGLSQPEWQTPGQAFDRVKSLEPGYGVNRTSAGIREATRLLSAMPEDRPKVLHVIGDLQASSLADIDQCRIPADVDLRVARIGPDKLSNRGVTVSVVSAGMTDVGVYGFNDGSGGSLALDENGEKKPLPIAPDQDAIRLGHGGKKGEWMTRKLSLEDDDALTADNTAWDVFQAQEKIPVWLWEPTGELPAPVAEATPPPPAPRFSGFSRPPIPKPVPQQRRVFDQASYYVSRALQPAAGAEGDATSRYEPLQLLEKDLSTALEKAGSPGSPRLLIVPATTNPPPALVELARKLMAAGGSIIVFGGPEWDPAAFPNSFGPISGVSPGAPVPIKATTALAEIPDSNPLWGSLDSEFRRDLIRSPLKTRHELTLATGARALAAYADGTPFVVENTSGTGHCWFINSSANRAWGDWPASGPLFVPALHLLAARAIGDQSFAPAQAPVLAGESTTLRLSAKSAGRSLKSGDHLFPVDAEGRVPGVIFDKPGVTDLVLDDGTKAGRIAVNFPPVESALDYESEGVVRQRLESLRQHGEGTSIRWEGEAAGGLAWRLCLVLAALLLVVEPLIANHRRARA